MSGDSATTDEPVHIAAGVEIAREGTGRWNPEHPPLAKALAGLALTGMPVRPAEDPIASPSHGGLLIRFLYENQTPADAILFRARLPFVALFLALLWGVRREAGRLFGTAAGGVALAFTALDPNLIAHAGVVHTDLAVTLFLVLSLGPLSRIPDLFDRLAPVWLGLAWGLMFLSKYSAPLLVLVTLPLMFVGEHGNSLLRRIQRGMTGQGTTGEGTTGGFLRKVIGKGVGGDDRATRTDAAPVQTWREIAQLRNDRAARGEIPRVLLRLLLSTFMATLVVLFGFFLAYRNQTSSDRDALARDRLLVKGHSVASSDFAVSAGRLLPPLGNVATGALSVMLQNRVGAGPTYFLGTVREAGSPWYFPVAFLVKVSIGLLAGAAVGAFSSRGRRLALFVLAGLLAFFLFSAGSAYNIGVRHLLFAFPLLAILAAAGTPVDGLPKGRALLVTALLLVESIEVLGVHPHELAFFNAFADGPDGGRRLLVDSNLDWGQDLARLATAVPRWSPDPIPAIVFGGDLPRRYPTLRPLAPGDEDKPGAIIAVGETAFALGPELLASKGAKREAERLDALRRTLKQRGKRIGTIGGSIGIWSRNQQ